MRTAYALRQAFGIVSKSVAVACVLGLGGCASWWRGEAPPAPPPPSYQVSMTDWRGIITADDRIRYDNRNEAWSTAVAQANSQPGSGNLASLSYLLQADTVSEPIALMAGHYRCRTIKLGSQGGNDGLGYVVYGWFSCHIEDTPQGLRFVKLTGSQRPQGILYPEGTGRMVFLGGLAVGAEDIAPAYNTRPERDVVGVIEQIGPNHWRMVMPWPRFESVADILELVPAA